MNETASYSKILPPTLLLVAALLMLGSYFLFPLTQIVPGLWRFLGLLPLVLGLTISVAAEKQRCCPHSLVRIG